MNRLKLATSSSYSITTVGSGIATATYTQVWLRDGQRLNIIQQMRFNTHLIGIEQSFSFDEARKILTTRDIHYRSGDCTAAYRQLTFEWTGSEFQLKKKTAHLTE